MGSEMCIRDRLSLSAAAATEKIEKQTKTVRKIPNNLFISLPPYNKNPIASDINDVTAKTAPNHFQNNLLSIGRSPTNLPV